MAKRRLIFIAAILFFFGLPLAGILLPYLSAHKAMRASGEKFVFVCTGEVLGHRDWSALEDYGTLTLKQELKKETFEKWLTKLGEFKSLGDLEVTRSWVSTRGDRGWQFVSFVGQATFANSIADLRITVARRSVVLDEWRVEAFEIVVPGVE